jgi:hypothetical protein
MFPVRKNDFLEEALKSAVVTPQKGEPVRSITMVGALFDDSLTGDLSIVDEYYLLKVFEICSRKSIPIAADVKIALTNLDYGSQHDFLKDPKPADMLILSYLFYNPIGIALHQGKASFTSGTRQSPYAADSGRWHKSVLQTGARYVFNIVSAERENELPTSFLDRAPYRRIDTIPDFPALEYDLLAR